MTCEVVQRRRLDKDRPPPQLLAGSRVGVAWGEGIKDDADGSGGGRRRLCRLARVPGVVAGRIPAGRLRQSVERPCGVRAVGAVGGRRHRRCGAAGSGDRAPSARRRAALRGPDRSGRVRQGAGSVLPEQRGGGDHPDRGGAARRRRGPGVLLDLRHLWRSRAAADGRDAPAGAAESLWPLQADDRAGAGGLFNLCRLPLGVPALFQCGGRGRGGADRRAPSSGDPRHPAGGADRAGCEAGLQAVRRRL